MRIRLAALGVAAFLVAVPVLANVCDLSCEMPRQTATPSCHEQAAPRQGGSHSPASCTHDHQTIRAVVKAQAVALDAMTAALHARVHATPVVMPSPARVRWNPARASTFASPPFSPLRI